jgi:hypothetical protein
MGSTLSGKSGKLSSDDYTQACPRILRKTIVELPQKTLQLRFQFTNLFGIHADSSIKPIEEHSFVNLACSSKAN